MNPSGTVVLKRGRAKPVLQRHPWIFSGAIDRLEGEPNDGDVVDVRDAGRNWLARGTLNRRSQIVVRLLTWRQDETVDREFWRGRLAQAISARAALAADPATTAYRLVHAESDYLPGLIVDRYGDHLVVQVLTLGIERRREEVVSLLAELVSPRSIYERSDVDVRAKEGLAERAGRLDGEDPPSRLEILENGHRFLVDVHRGHKTGFYLDQRPNRARLAPFCEGADVLDVFAYSGPFAIYALGAGALHATLVDSSAAALALAHRARAANNVGGDRFETVEGDAFSVLRGYRGQGRCFDAVVLDPPKFASSQRDVTAASRAYKDINLLAFQLLKPGGVLLTTSCSGAVSADLFQKILFGALVDAGRDGQIVGRVAQGCDHPVALTFPEGAYLKGLIVRVL